MSGFTIVRYAVDAVVCSILGLSAVSGDGWWRISSVVVLATSVFVMRLTAD